MHEKAKFVCFIFTEPQKVKFKTVQKNMKQISYSICSSKESFYSQETQSLRFEVHESSSLDTERQDGIYM